MYCLWMAEQTSNKEEHVQHHRCVLLLSETVVVDITLGSWGCLEEGGLCGNRRFQVLS